MMVIFLFHSFYNLLCMDRFPFGTDLMTLYEEMNLFLCTVRLVKLVVGITVIIFQKLDHVNKKRELGTCAIKNTVVACIACGLKHTAFTVHP